MKTRIFVVISVAACVWIVGCTRDTALPAASSPTTNSPTNDSTAAIDGSPYLLSEKPEAAIGVIQVREAAKDNDEIVIVGRIGGSKDPWIEGRAAFSIVDQSLKSCSDIPGDKCPNPWDYCCETPKLPNATALVKVVDASGGLVKADARKLLAVKELSTVVVKGKAERDDAGNLTVLASGVYVQK